MFRQNFKQSKVHIFAEIGLYLKFFSAEIWSLKLDDKNINKSVNSKAQRKAESAVKEFVTDSSFKHDPFGSYTGHSKESKSKPEQDVDDL